MMIRLVALCGLALTAGCAEDLSVSEIALAGNDCTKYICGANSPYFGALPFFELDQTGTEPAPGSGLRITGFWKGFTPLQVRVIGARFGAMTPSGTLWQGTQLKGAKLYLKDAKGIAYRVNFEVAVKQQPYWEAGDDDTTLESWALTWKQLPLDNLPPRPLCPIATDPDDKLFVAPGHHALIFRGDRYDILTGGVKDGASVGPWFNIACAGDVLSKLLVIRHAYAAQDAAHPTSTDQREAAIRMFRADYCGDGPNTELGIPLDWENVGGWNTLDEDPDLTNIEAIWYAGGARCLTHPRFIDYAAVPCDGIPKCTDWAIKHWQQLGDFITINPSP